MSSDDESSSSKREQILAFIVEHPAAHLRMITRELGFSMGLVQYHLERLEKERRIVSRRSGFYRRFYPALVFGDKQLEIMDVLAQETERDILLFLMQNPNASQKDISAYAKISPSSINWHMQRLSTSGLVEIIHQGAKVRYLVRVNRTEMLSLLRSYHSTIWERWADRLADLLSE